MRSFHCIQDIASDHQNAGSAQCRNLDNVMHVVCSTGTHRLMGHQGQSLFGNHVLRTSHCLTDAAYLLQPFAARLSEYM